VGDDQRERVGLRRADVQEVDLLSVDRGEELRVCVDALLLCAPVESLAPAGREFAHVRQRGAIVPASFGDLVGPANTS
jgi:hypothetical protein